jgi:uncharacterized protein YeeX (DUF496 family)
MARITKNILDEVINQIVKAKDNDYEDYLGDYFIDALMVVLKFKNYKSALKLSDDHYEDIYNYQDQINKEVYKSKWW